MLTGLYHLFPATIHPMVIHFTIAITYLAALAGLAGFIFRREEVFAKSFFYLLCLGIVATLAAGVAGVISESYDHVSRTVAPILSQHKRMGELTGLLLVVSTACQAFSRARSRRVNPIAWLICLGAVLTVSWAGWIGGDLVYHHALGVHLDG